MRWLSVTRTCLPSLGPQPPPQDFARSEWRDRKIAVADLARYGVRLATQCNLRLVDWQSVERRPVKRGESLELVEGILLIEHLGIEFERRRRGKNAGAAAGGLLGRDRVRGAVRPEKETRVPRDRRAAQRQAVLLALGNRQAVEMGTNAALEDGVSVDDQMMRGDRRREVFFGFADIGGGLFRSDVLEHDAQIGKPSAQRLEGMLDEHRLAIEDIDFRIGCLTVDQ